MRVGWLEARPRRLGGLDYAVALVLALLTVGLLLATTDVGFPRDEGFYFRYSAQYQEWFYDVEDELARSGPNPSLQRDTVNTVWRGNAEHPPLAKVLFGYSWRAFSAKLRPILSVDYIADEELVRIGSLRKGEGFDIGELVWLLRPASVSAPEPWRERVVGTARVLDSEGGTALASVLDGHLGEATYAATCTPAAGPDRVPVAMSGCQALPQSGALLAESTGFRLPTIAVSALLVAAIFLFGALLSSRLAALAAALLFLFVPRHFFHMHMTAFDTMVTAMMFFTVVAFWHSLRSFAWVIVAGVVWGLAILTKHNAWFTPVTLGLWWLSGARFRPKLRVPRMPRAFVSMLAIGLPLFVLLWPRLWYDGWEHFRWYVAFHSKHDHYMQHYFGHVLAYPPFPVLFPFALSAMTWPVTSLLVVVFGAGRLVESWWRSRRDGGGAADDVAEGPYPPFGVPSLLAIQALWPILLISLPNTPVFGGVKHWMPAMPFVALIGGIGVDAAWRGTVAAWERRRGAPPRVVARTCAAFGLLGLVLAPGARATLHAHPDGTAYWNELTGGAPGAADLGMQRQFWGYSTRRALDYLNRHVPQGATVYFHKSVRDAWEMYRKEGLLRWDIQHTADIFDVGVIAARLRRTPYAVYHHQKDHDEYELAVWEAYGTHTPVWQASYDGVPIVSVYRNPRYAP